MANERQPTQHERLQTAHDMASRGNETMLDLLFGKNPISDEELAHLIVKRPHVYGKLSAYLGKRTAGGLTPCAVPDRGGGGVASLYYSCAIPWEPDPARRTKWHPTDPPSPERPDQVLTRGVFASEAEARTWASENLGPGAVYDVRAYERG